MFVKYNIVKHYWNQILEYNGSDAYNLSLQTLKICMM